MGTYTITMSAPATATGSPGQTGVGGSFAFVGSLYTSATTPAGQPTTTPGSIPTNSNIMTIDPNVGMYLRPGMMVTGSQIPAGTYIAATPGSISADFTTITLTQSIGGTASSGPYTFVGAPDSYVLQTLINNWYAWADYYVTQLASGPNAAPSGTFQATTTTYTNIYTIGSTDLNAVTLTNIPASFDMNQLRVGDVVTAATAGTLNPNTTGAAQHARLRPQSELHHREFRSVDKNRGAEPPRGSQNRHDRHVHVRSPPVCRTVERRAGREPHFDHRHRYDRRPDVHHYAAGMSPDSLAAKRRSRSAA